MSELLFHYKKVNPTTWAYLSSLLMIGLYFKFSRFWSVRNIDLVLLVLLAPGLLLTYYGRENERNAWFYYRQALASEAAKDQATSEMQPADGAASNSSDGPSALGSDAGGATSEPKKPLDPPGEKPVEKPGDSAAGQSAPDDSATSAAKDEAVDPVKRAEKRWKDARADLKLGFIWLLAIGVVFLGRMLVDPTMVRRPLLEPNLSMGGLIFIGCSLFVFLMANVITSIPTDDELNGARRAEQLLKREKIAEEDHDLARRGPGYALLNLLPVVPTMSLMNPPSGTGDPLDAYAITSKAMAILSHLAVVIGIVAIGYRHFDNLRMGIGAATMYLMLPYTAVMTGRVDHVLPSALLIWAIACYRRPLSAGVLIGLATGVVYYPIFLLPLWVSFYWQRGVWRFILGLGPTLALMVLSLIFVSADLVEFRMNVQKMFGLWFPTREGLEGIWGLGWDPVYRLPILTAFVAMSCSLAIWPAQKNLGTLLSCSAAVMVGTQFWHGHGGGLYMAWFLPLILLTIFRPNLEDRVALAVLSDGYSPPRRAA